ncbi:ATP-binding protein [Candidatus Thiothrix sp. Deng01]|uniref:ATP-binding protein n=1 Tax=Candidatus Thiothrix phosphatis TaxID=3112415 RepID=A0ABU6CSL1_9GAMM|nr:ATP-binding protein [Candidatus Thiothrix sp. Deng01]MEB4589826.1 ATP-binding protein [Candidatus Thiothrix sp. Deng01]
MNFRRLLRVFGWLPLYLLGLYLLAQQLDQLDFAPAERWKVELTGEPSGLVYTARLPPTIGEIQEPALLVLNVQQNVAVYYANGTQAGGEGSMQTPVSRNKHRPLLFRLYDQAALRPGELLTFRVATTSTHRAYLQNVYLGPVAELKQSFERNDLWRQETVKAVVAILLLTALLIGSMWVVYPRRKEYLWYAISTSLWAAHSSNLLARDIPIDDAIWAGIVPLLIGLSMVSLITMVYYYVGLNKHRSRPYGRWLRHLWLATLVLAVPLFFPLNTGEVSYTLIWEAYLSLVFSLVLAYLLWLYGREQNTRRLLMLLCGFAMLTFGVHDAIVAQTKYSTSPFLLHFAALLTLMAQYFLLVRRFIYSLRQSQYYATHLETLVAEREQELEQRYQQIHVMEQEKAKADERERIMRDIHDGFGGHLVSTLAMLERPDVSLLAVKANIQDALGDLRLVIDSLDFDSQDITTALGMFRSRTMRKIKQAGFDLRWGIEDIATPTGFGAEKILQLLRIVQEAVTNSLKHSGGNSITISTGTDANGRSFIQIADNGDGIPASYQAGKGLASMRKRAGKIGADIDICNLPAGSGAQVRITLPTDNPALAC